MVSGRASALPLLVFIESEEIVKDFKLKKILNDLRSNPRVMGTADAYAAGRDYGCDDQEARDFVRGIFNDTKAQMLMSSVFRAGYSRALIDIEEEVKFCDRREILAERKRRAAEFLDLIPGVPVKDELYNVIHLALEDLEHEGN